MYIYIYISIFPSIHPSIRPSTIHISHNITLHLRLHLHTSFQSWNKLEPWESLAVGKRSAATSKDEAGNSVILFPFILIRNDPN